MKQSDPGSPPARKLNGFKAGICGHSAPPWRGMPELIVTG
jgi:hypothetical protein